MNYVKQADLPLWGPYSKKYMGVSKIVKDTQAPGSRFDLVVYPTIANSSVPIPNVTVPSAYHPWDASKDLHFFSYRCDLEWKDQVYADVSFSQLDSDTVVIRTEIVNHTDLGQNCVINYFSAMEYPHPGYTALSLPKKNLFWDALNYKNFDYANPRPWDMLNPDGAKKGEFLDCQFINNRGLGDRVDHSDVPHLKLQPFGFLKDDRVTYCFENSRDFDHAVLSVRYRTVEPFYGQNRGLPASFRVILSGGHEKYEGVFSMPQTEKMGMAHYALGSLPSGSYELQLISEGTCGVEFDFFAIVEEEEQEQIHTAFREYEVRPQMEIDGTAVHYRYDRVEEDYYLHIFNPNTRFRELNSGSIEDAPISRLSNADPTFDDILNQFSFSFSRKHSDKGFYHNLISHSIFIDPGKTEVNYAVIGGKEVSSITREMCEQVYQREKARIEPLSYTKAGKPYELSNRLLRAATMTNIVYPIYRHGKYIAHFTPGKRWDSLYTWDSGFIALGLLECDPRLSEYIINLYFAEEDNRDFAYLHHGSPVPVEIYVYLEMLKRASAQEKNRLYHYYQRAKKFYDFLAGKKYGSVTAKFHSGLTGTYDYFKNTSGMDDLPPQEYTHLHRLEGVVSTAISPSQVILSAKVLKQIAYRLGLSEDVSDYEKEIEKLTRALQEYSWDPECGYFSYVVHDENMEPIGIMRNEDGENLDKGLDGIYPLIAGVCTEQQQKILLDHLKSDKELWSKVGISAVDMSAGYYINNGYWNGNVWFAHQWFVWKTMLDLGERDFAFKIADTALQSWKKEVDHSYYTFEMLNIATGRGGWFHHFSGLSTPINIWANAYYRKGTISSGLNMWIDSQKFNDDYTNCEIVFENQASGNSSFVIVVMDEQKGPYKATYNGTSLSIFERVPGTLEILLDSSQKCGTIRIFQKTNSQN